jgi:outer membrane protein OmpA-like peptidoglycan-associated protein
MGFRSSLRWFGCVAALIVASGAEAQDRFDVEALDSVTASDGSVVTLYGGHTLQPGLYALSFQGSYGRKPLSMESPTGASLGDLVGSIGTLQLLGAVGVYKRVEVGLGVPVHRVSAGTSFDSPPPRSVQVAAMSQSKVALGDVRIVPRVSLYEHGTPAGFDLAVLASVWLPTGGKASYAGESLRVEPRLALDYSTRTWLIALNAGYLVRGAANVLGTALDDQLRVGVGALVDLGKHFGVLAEWNTRFNVLAKDFGNDDVASEALAGLRYRAGGLVAQLGGGPGIVRGVGVPTYRILGSVELSGVFTQPRVGDADGDSLADDIDQCVNQAEDKDDFEDQDGCPDLDNDADGIFDVVDRCPQQPEDQDGFEDEDGCPDLDNDADGVFDVADRCPQQPEDQDGFEDEDGCPDLDNDADGVADVEDQCPLEAGVVVAHGCPAPVAPPEPATATLTQEKIELRETVLFGNNNAEIQAVSFAVLDTVAKLLADHPAVESVVVEGHTDDRGARKHNQKLSEARAKSVVAALVARGIAATRLSSVGYGPTKPLVANDSPENRAKNRRVELRIARRRAE